MAVGEVKFTGLNGGVVEVASLSIERFRASLGCPLLHPGDGGFDDAILIWNAIASKTPALVVQPTGTDDVVRAVEFAGLHGLLLSIKGGGHNIAGTLGRRRCPDARHVSHE